MKDLANFCWPLYFTPPIMILLTHSFLNFFLYSLNWLQNRQLNTNFTELFYISYMHRNETALEFSPFSRANSLKLSDQKLVEMRKIFLEPLVTSGAYSSSGQIQSLRSKWTGRASWPLSSCQAKRHRVARRTTAFLHLQLCFIPSRQP